MPPTSSVPVFDRTGGVDGYVSLEVSPVLAHDAATTAREAARLHALGARPNLFIKIPGTAEGLPAIEDSIFAGVPVNVTLLFSRPQYLACAEAYTRGIERRIEAGLPAAVGSVASVFISRWDPAVEGSVPGELRNRLGIAIGQQVYAEYRRYFATDRWGRLLNEGARPQRLLFASTGTKDPAASDVLYIEGLAAPHTVNTMPEETLLAFADHGHVGSLLTADPAAADGLLARFAAAGVDVEAVGSDLQAKGAESFVKSWGSLLARIETRAAQVGPRPAEPAGPLLAVRLDIDEALTRINRPLYKWRLRRHGPLPDAPRPSRGTFPCPRHPPGSARPSRRSSTSLRTCARFACSTRPWPT